MRTREDPHSVSQEPSANVERNTEDHVSEPSNCNICVNVLGGATMRVEKALGISIFSLQALYIVIVFLVGYSTISTVMASVPSGSDQEGGLPLDLSIEKEAGGGRIVALAFPVHNRGLLPVEIRVRVRFETQAGDLLIDEESSRQIPAGRSNVVGLTFTVSREKLEQALDPNTGIEGMVEYKTLYGLVSASVIVETTVGEVLQGGG